MSGQVRVGKLSDIAGWIDLTPHTLHHHYIFGSISYVIHFSSPLYLTFLFVGGYCKVRAYLN